MAALPAIQKMLPPPTLKCLEQAHQACIPGQWILLFGIIQLKTQVTKNFGEQNKTNLGELSSSPDTSAVERPLSYLLIAPYQQGFNCTSV